MHGACVHPIENNKTNAPQNICDDCLRNYLEKEKKEEKRDSLLLPDARQRKASDMDH